MKTIIYNIFCLVLISTCLFSCSYHPKGWRFYYLQNDTEDTVFYKHAYVLGSTTNIQTEQNTIVWIDVIDTILPNDNFYFAKIERDQRLDAKQHSLAYALSEKGSIIPVDSVSCFLEYKGVKHYVYPLDRESFYYIQNYEFNHTLTVYLFYLREYLEKLEARE